MVSVVRDIAGEQRGLHMNTSDEFQREGLSIFEACFIAGLGRTKIYSAIADGGLRARKYGKRTIILRDDLRQFLAALPIVTPQVVSLTNDTSRG